MKVILSSTVCSVQAIPSTVEAVDQTVTVFIRCSFVTQSTSFIRMQLFPDLLWLHITCLCLWSDENLQNWIKGPHQIKTMHLWMWFGWMRIGHKCVFHVDARMLISSIRMHIQCGFVDNCGQAYRAANRTALYWLSGGTIPIQGQRVGADADHLGNY